MRIFQMSCRKYMTGCQISSSHNNHLAKCPIVLMPRMLRLYFNYMFQHKMIWAFLCVGNSPVPGEFPAQRPVTRSFDVFFDLRLNKRLRKQSWGWWFETLSRPLWRQCNVKKHDISALQRPLTVWSGRRPYGDVFGPKNYIIVMD